MACFALSREGCTRSPVLVIGPLALKFARDERGRRCNLYEAHLYKCDKRVNASRRAMLCPVLWCAPIGIFLVMRAACPITQEECKRLKETGGFPKWEYMGNGDLDYPFEYKASEWGRIDGRLVALDYSTHAVDDTPVPESGGRTAP